MLEKLQDLNVIQLILTYIQQALFDIEDSRTAFAQKPFVDICHFCQRLYQAAERANTRVGQLFIDILHKVDPQAIKTCS